MPDTLLIAFACGVLDVGAPVPAAALGGLVFFLCVARDDRMAAARFCWNFLLPWLLFGALMRLQGLDGVLSYAVARYAIDGIGVAAGAVFLWLALLFGRAWVSCYTTHPRPLFRTSLPAFFAGSWAPVAGTLTGVFFAFWAGAWPLPTAMLLLQEQLSFPGLKILTIGAFLIYQAVPAAGGVVVYGLWRWARTATGRSCLKRWRSLVLVVCSAAYAALGSGLMAVFVQRLINR